MKQKTIIEQAVKGDPEAFCELYGLYKDRLFRYAFYRLEDTASAEDAVSECVLAAWKGIGSLRNPKAFSAWIFRILNAVCAKQIRVRITERNNMQELFKETHRIVPDSSRALELSDALGKLTDEEREIVLLSIVAGLKSREIASMFGMTAGSVRSKLSRSLSKMKQYLEMES